MWCIRNRLGNQKNTSTVWKTILPLFSMIQICYKIHLFGNNFVRPTVDGVHLTKLLGLEDFLQSSEIVTWGPEKNMRAKCPPSLWHGGRWKKPRTLPRADLQPKTNQCREKHLYKSCDQEHISPLAEIQGSSVQNKLQLVISPSLIVEPGQKSCPMNRHPSTNI